MRKLCVLTIAFLSGIIFTVNAQDTTAVAAPATETPAGLSISGSVDAYYRRALNADRGIAPPTSFANLHGFAFGMANLVVAHEGKRAGFVGDLVFGPRGDEAVFNSIGNPAIVNQLYAYWKATDALKITLGNFNTFLGYEVISPVGNYNYSTSYMFSYGPFSHTGLRADYSINDNLSAMVAIMNPTDFTEFNPTNTYTLGAQLGYSVDRGAAYLNFLYGDQDGAVDAGELDPATGDVLTAKPMFQVDLTTGWNLTERFYLGLNTTYNSTTGAIAYVTDGTSFTKVSSNISSGFYGVALYPQYSFTDNFSLGLRGEYFSEYQGGVGALGAYDAAGDASVIELTLSSNIKAGNLTVIPEIRYDQFSENIVPNGTALQNNLISGLIAFVYAF